MNPLCYRRLTRPKFQSVLHDSDNMNHAWNLLLIALLQSSANEPNSPAAARDEPAMIQAETVPLDELKQRVATGEFVAIPRNLVQQLQSGFVGQTTPIDTANGPQIRKARYTATLNGTRLEAGTLEFELRSDSSRENSGPLLIGSTSLQQLKLFDDQGPVVFGSDASQKLFILRPGMPERLSGTWGAEGLVAGEVVSFRLELPEATISEIKLLTLPDIQVTSAGSLALGPEVTEGGLKWRLIPGDATRIAFSCRTQPDLSVQGPLALTGFSASHTVTGDSLSSRWTIGVPAAMSRTKSNRTMMSIHLPENVRVTDVVLEDRRSVEWTASRENRKQLLKLLVPASSPGMSLTVSGISVLPQAEMWSLPMASPSQWQSEDGKHRGPILTPVSQISVFLPVAMELDEWILAGIQERDVVTRPDQSREYQLIQFLPEASAVVRTSSSQARISDSIVTLVEPAGRLATVRCLVNVRCEGAAVLELKWPVTPGWQILAARYASNKRALFFEFPNDHSDVTAVPLTVHLPESLEPGASRVFEIQLQQSDNADPVALRLPLLVSPNAERTNSLVVFPPVFSLNSELQRQWSAGQRSMTTDEIQNLAPWFPEARLLSGMQVFPAGDNWTLSAQRLPADDVVDNQFVQLEHAIRIVDGLIVENSRLSLPPDFALDIALTFAVPASAGTDLRWSVDGEAVTAKREDTSESAPEWRHWTLSPGARRLGMPGVIRCESRRKMNPEFVANIPFLQAALKVEGTLQLFSSDEGLLSAEDLDSEAGNAEAKAESTIWRLPAEPKLIQINIDQNPRIQSGQTIDVQMLHLIGERDGGLQREVLAIANISRSVGKNWLPLSLPGISHLLVLVNGHRVQLQETADGLAIPLPQSSADCQVLLTWKEPGEHPDRITGMRQLPRLFLSELSVPQCTHHVLVDPGLRLEAPRSLFAASEPTEITRVLDQMLVKITADGAMTQSSEISIPAEVRQFVIRWQLAAVQGWQPQTLIDSVADESPVVIWVTQVRRRLAIAAGTFLVVVAGCVGLRQFVSGYCFTAAIVALIVLGTGFLTPSPIGSAAAFGVFWGLSVGLLLVMIFRWYRLRTIARNSVVRRVATSTIWLLLATTGLAAPQDNSGAKSPSSPPAARTTIAADILVPEPPVPGSDVVFVRRQVLDAWRQRQSRQRLLTPAAIIISSHSRIIVESVESAEVHLELEVAAANGVEDTTLRIPLQGSRFVECFVDGVRVLPDPDGADSIRVRVPASAQLSFMPLAGDSEIPSEADSAGRASVDARPNSTFTVHKIKCRLRPLASRQTSGVLFRLPGLPCPVTSVEVDSPAGLYTNARAQTPEGIVEWNPSDGKKLLNSLAMSDGIDVRLLQTGVEKSSPRPASVQILVISEIVSSQQVLTCVTRFSQWDILTPEVRYRIPKGYRLVAVAAATGADVITDLLWSVKERNAIVQLPAGIGNEFVLSFQLVCLTPAVVQNQPVPIAELQQFTGCIAAPNLLLAARANSVFSVLPVEGNQVSTVLAGDLQTDWGQWLRRSDSVFRVPSGNPECTIRLVPRKSINEVRVFHDVSIYEGQIDWNCQFDVETSVQAVFRHRVRIPTDILITDVQVVAGEANRLDSWHRRSDQLVIQLKEGTTGPHSITISGRQAIRPDDVLLTLRSPILQKTEIPQTSMTLVDRDGLGLTFVKLGGAEPDDRIREDDLLPPEMPLRMEITDEADPVVLQRIRPVDPIGTIAAIRSVDHVTFVLHITQWSSSLGTLRMVFSDDAEFKLEPVVLANGQQLRLSRQSNVFVADENVIPSLFDQPEFTVIWSMRLTENETSQDTTGFAWPDILERIQWSEMLLVPLDSAPVSAELAVDSATIPDWLTAAGKAVDEDLALYKFGAINLPLDSAMKEKRLLIPIQSATDRVVVETGDVVALSDTIVWSDHGQSAVGETVLLLFAARTPSKCSIQIPDGTVVTELRTAESTRWENTARKKVLIELNKPVTIVRTRWLSRRSEEKAVLSQLQLKPPFPADCTLDGTLTVVSENGQRPVFRNPANVLSQRELLAAQVSDIGAGLKHAKSNERPLPGKVYEPLPSVESLSLILSTCREEFLNGFQVEERIAESSLSYRANDAREISVSISQRIELSSVFSWITGIFVLCVAAVARKLNYSAKVLPPTKDSALKSHSTAPESLRARSENAIASEVSASGPLPEVKAPSAQR